MGVDQQVPADRRAVTAAGPAAWLLYLGCGAAMLGGYYLLPLLSLPDVTRVIAYVAISCSACVAVVVGIRWHRPAHRAPWILVASGQFIYAIGDLVFYLNRIVLENDRYPGVDDAFYLVSFPVMAAGLLLFIRARTPSWDLPSAADAAVVAAGAGLLIWVFLMSPQLADDTQSWAARAVSVAYPAMDLLLFTVTIRMAMGTVNGTPPHRLLYGWIGLGFVADVCYGYQELTGAYNVGNFLDAMWLTAALLLGAAALHPAMNRLDTAARVPDPDTSAPRMTLLALASLVAPALLYIQYLRGAPLHVPEVAACSAASFLLVIARMAGMVRLQRRVAITDGLTGLRSRRFFDELLQTEVARHDRHEAGTSLLLVDIDHFKRINDGYGHLGGDQVLTEVARRMAAVVRRGDLVARYGGEEFAILLPRTGPDKLAQLGERVRRTVAAAPVRIDGNQVAVTVSVGGAELAPGQDPDDLLRAADAALYAAKDAGRDRLVVGSRPILLAQPS
jgi:diguanylate cyclase (GGDEF)-like protein